MPWLYWLHFQNLKKPTPGFGYYPIHHYQGGWCGWLMPISRPDHELPTGGWRRKRRQPFLTPFLELFFNSRGTSWRREDPYPYIFIGGGRRDWGPGTDHSRQINFHSHDFVFSMWLLIYFDEFGYCNHLNLWIPNWINCKLPNEAKIFFGLLFDPFGNLTRNCCKIYPVSFLDHKWHHHCWLIQ